MIFSFVVDVIFGSGSGEYKCECGLDMRLDCIVKGLLALEDDLFEGLAPKEQGQSSLHFL